MIANDNLLMTAYAIYKSRGVLPFDIAAQLMEAGFIVNELEARWDRLPMEAE